MNNDNHQEQSSCQGDPILLLREFKAALERDYREKDRQARGLTPALALREWVRRIVRRLKR